MQRFAGIIGDRVIGRRAITQFLRQPSEAVGKRAGRAEDRLEIRVLELLAEFEHELGEDAGLEKDGVERHLQEALADLPEAVEDGLRLVRREWPTDIGPVDLMCRDPDGEWVAVEIKRVGTIEAVEQLSRYLEVLQRDPTLATCRGILAAESVKPQARTLCAARGLGCGRAQEFGAGADSSAGSDHGARCGALYCPLR